MPKVIPQSVESASLLSGLSVYRGFDRGVADQVVEKSQQPTILQMAPRDAGQRFPDVEHALSWFESSPNRIFYSLAHHAHFAGIIWFSQTDFHDAQYTFAARMYEPFNGRGLGAAFGEVAHADLATGYEGSVWADIHIDNVPSQRLAKKLGYQGIDGHVSDDPSRIQLIRPTPEV